MSRTFPTSRRQSKLVHEGEYVAELQVELLDSPEGWAPYLSFEDTQKLDEVREALDEETPRQRESSLVSSA